MPSTDYQDYSVPSIPLLGESRAEGLHGSLLMSGHRACLAVL
jgi:hypothetical protein